VRERRNIRIVRGGEERRVGLSTVKGELLAK
jgi:hypothetical protein